MKADNYNIKKKKIDINAGMPFNGTSTSKIRKIGTKTKYFVHSKIDDTLLFESFNIGDVHAFIMTTDLK